MAIERYQIGPTRIHNDHKSALSEQAEMCQGHHGVAMVFIFLSKVLGGMGGDESHEYGIILQAERERERERVGLARILSKWEHALPEQTERWPVDCAKAMMFVFFEQGLGGTEEGKSQKIL